MKKVDTIILDFNGTILDDLDLCFNVLNKMLVMYNHKPVTLEEYLDIFTFPVIEYYRKAGFNFDMAKRFAPASTPITIVKAMEKLSGIIYTTEEKFSAA